MLVFDLRVDVVADANELSFDVKIALNGSALIRVDPID